jgi:hypothetical protein
MQRHCTQIPANHGEPFHILRYNPEEEYVRLP